MGIDQAVLNFFAENRVEWLSFIMLVVTYAGSYMLVGSLTFLSAIFFFIHKHAARILPLLVSVAGSATTMFILKYLLERDRPSGSLYMELSPSFPSGHATMAIALYGFILYIVWTYDRHPLRNPFIIFLAILIMLIGLSRLYLGVHYLSDVLAGYAVGLVWLFISVRLYRKIEKLIHWRPKLRN